MVDTKCSHIVVATKNICLFTAVKHGKASLNEFKRFVCSGGNVNLQDPEGNTALHWAVLMGNETAVEMLLSLGADFCIVNHLGLTPYEKAVSHGNVKIQKLFPEMAKLNYQEVERADCWSYLSTSSFIESDQISARIEALIEARLVEERIRIVEQERILADARIAIVEAQLEEERAKIIKQGRFYETQLLDEYIRIHEREQLAEDTVSRLEDRIRVLERDQKVSPRAVLERQRKSPHVVFNRERKFSPLSRTSDAETTVETSKRVYHKSERVYLSSDDNDKDDEYY